ncbi:MAG: WD40 repeat domain-containing protein, partial [Gemmatimonadota bacterium]|nr:WD40 repeat domain-containing protein [Gemmatimonadota bacterium]
MNGPRSSGIILASVALLFGTNTSGRQQLHAVTPGRVDQLNTAVNVQVKATLKGHGRAINSVSYTPGGTTLVSGGGDRTVRLWDLSSVSSPTPPGEREGQSQDYLQRGLPEGALFRLGKGRLGQSDRALAYSPDGKRLAVAGSTGIWLYDTHSGDEVALHSGHKAWVSAVAYSNDGVSLASGGVDGTIRIWDSASGQLKTTLGGHEASVTSVAFSPDGTTLASGSTDETVRLWHAASGELKVILEGHTGAVHSVAFSPDGTTLASGSTDET